MTIRTEILEKYSEFNAFLKSVSLDELKKDYTRLELNEFHKQLHAMDLRELAYELTKLTDAMKKEEFPSLTGVHYFPVIKEMHFLTQDEQLKLDKYLARLRKGYRVNNWHLVTAESEKYKLIEKFLIEKEIVFERSAVLCPGCNDLCLSEYLNKEQKENFENLVKKYHETRDDRLFLEISIILDANYCDDCENSVDFEEITHYTFEDFLLMKAAPDLSLENIK